MGCPAVSIAFDFVPSLRWRGVGIRVVLDLLWPLSATTFGSKAS